ncbi:retinitis pigmentosa 9 protein [Cololabis saira]|uniref:retinitis pigmentosa 9 protein n=1 Tax=Cololabis saira TaxID=129043 RepID=UPI002AD2ACD4|nr:retinitis pigmentosa 9 protein [Cololabis saira]
MSERKRKREKDETRHHKKHKSPKHDVEKLKTHKKKLTQEAQQLKHIETFYEKPPPGLVKEHEEKPEDCIPDESGNEEARRFLAQAPTRGLWMPLGKEVKVMQCWRCKRYGHRTGDKECPFFIKGNQKLEQFRVAHEDPMYDIIRENKRNEKETRIQQLQQLLQDSTTSSSSSDSDSSSTSSSSSSDQHRSKRKKGKKEKKKKKKSKKRKKKRKSSKSSDSSDSD